MTNNSLLYNQAMRSNRFTERHSRGGQRSSHRMSSRAMILNRGNSSTSSNNNMSDSDSNASSSNMEDIHPDARYARAIERNLAKEPTLKSYLSNTRTNLTKSAAATGDFGSSNNQSRELDEHVRRMEVDWDMQSASRKNNTSVMMDVPLMSSTSSSSSHEDVFSLISYLVPAEEEEAKKEMDNSSQYKTSISSSGQDLEASSSSQTADSSVTSTAVAASDHTHSISFGTDLLGIRTDSQSYNKDSLLTFTAADDNHPNHHNQSHEFRAYTYRQGSDGDYRRSIIRDTAANSDNRHHMYSNAITGESGGGGGGGRDYYANYSNESQYYFQPVTNRRYSMFKRALIVAAIVATIGISSIITTKEKSSELQSDGDHQSGTDFTSTQRLALMDFYTHTEGLGWHENFGWNTEEDVCKWFGVACNDDGFVKTISLRRNNLSGSLTAKLSDLKYLQVLDVSENVIGGSLPKELGDLGDSLKMIYAFNNQFTSSIPAEFASLKKLKVLSLDNNELTGTIPEDLYLNDQMELFDVGSNHISGSIHANIGQMSSLKQLYLDENNFTSTMPSEIGNLSKMEYMYVHKNSLEGEVPVEIGNLTLLTEFLMYGNSLMGLMPQALCENRYLNEGEGGSLKALEADCIMRVSCDSSCCTRCF